MKSLPPKGDQNPSPIVKLEELRRQVDEGLKELDRGEGLLLDGAELKKYMKNVSKHGRQRLARRRTDK